MGSPKERGRHGYNGGRQNAGEDTAVSRGRDGLRRHGYVGRGTATAEPTEKAHQHHRKAQHVEDIDAQEIGPRNPAEAERVFLDAEKQAQGENLRAAADGCFEDLAGQSAYVAETLRHQREGNAGKKEEERRGERAAKLRPRIEGRLAGFRAKPRVVTMRLKHENAG